ncbi:hypothetical protein ACFPRL_23525 [Pseudoclavibacter helvolus]
MRMQSSGNPVGVTSVTRSSGPRSCGTLPSVETASPHLPTRSRFSSVNCTARSSRVESQRQRLRGSAAKPGPSIDRTLRRPTASPVSNTTYGGGEEFSSRTQACRSESCTVRLSQSSPRECWKRQHLANGPG